MRKGKGGIIAAALMLGATSLFLLMGETELRSWDGIAWDTFTRLRGSWRADISDSLAYRGGLQIIDLPGIAKADTVNAASDSSNVMVLTDSTLVTEHADYVHIWGNGSDSAELCLLGTAFVPLNTGADSVYWWMRADAVEPDSVKVTVVIKKKDRDGATTTAGARTVDVASLDTWERHGMAVSGLTREPWYVSVQASIRKSHYIDISPLYMK